jgi:hypothetical protein
MKPETIARKIEEIILKEVGLFGNEIILVQKKLYNDFLGLINQLELSDGYIKQTAANRAILNKAEITFNNSISTSGYQDALNRALGTISKLDTVNIAYFEGLDSAFKLNRQFLTSLQNSTIKTLENLVLNDGLNSQIRTPLMQILNQNVNTGGSFQGMLKQVQDYIIGNPEKEGRLLRYSKQIVSDTLFQYSRAYQASVTDDLGLEWYLYEGGVQDTSRPFCIARAGKFWNQKTIEGWASEEWQGKDPLTTESSIFILCGGFNCRHSLIPVHDSVVPKEDKKRFEEGSFE